MVQEAGFNNSFMWKDNDGGGFSASEFQKALFGSIDSDRDDASGFKDTKRIKLTESNHQEEELDIFKKPLLGLTLTKTPSFLDMVEMMSLSQAGMKHSPNSGEVKEKLDREREKKKASNFHATFLKIGSWERTAIYETDLVAKVYYAKKKIVWEILENGLKRKIEMQWSDIIGIKATIQENQAGVLELELNQPPTFSDEKDPQPRKHTLWSTSEDFTGGQASSFRRHYIRFPPKTLEKHYQKLIHCNEQLFALSQKPFPTLNSPYFSNFCGFSQFASNLNGRAQEIPRLQVPQASIPTTSLIRSHQVQSFDQSTKSNLFYDSTSPLSDESVNNHGFENPRTSFWPHGVNSTVMGRGDHFFQEVPFAASSAQVHPGFSNQNLACSTYGEEESQPEPNNQFLNDIKEHLLGDSQVVCSDENTLLARVQSMSSLLDQANMDFRQKSVSSLLDPANMDFRQKSVSSLLGQANMDLRQKSVSSLLDQANMDLRQKSVSSLLDQANMDFSRQKSVSSLLDQANMDFSRQKSVSSLLDQTNMDLRQKSVSSLLDQANMDFSRQKSVSSLLEQANMDLRQKSVSSLLDQGNMDFRRDQALNHGHKVQSIGDQSNGKDGLVYPQPMHSRPPPHRVSNESVLMHLPSDNSLYPYELSDPSLYPYNSSVYRRG